MVGKQKDQLARSVGAALSMYKWVWGALEAEERTAEEVGIGRRENVGGARRLTGERRQSEKKSGEHKAINVLKGARIHALFYKYLR